MGCNEVFKHTILPLTRPPKKLEHPWGGLTFPPSLQTRGGPTNREQSNKQNNNFNYRNETSDPCKLV